MRGLIIHRFVLSTRATFEAAFALPGAGVSILRETGASAFCGTFRAAQATRGPVIFCRTTSNT